MKNFIKNWQLELVATAMLWWLIFIVFELFRPGLIVDKLSLPFIWVILVLSILLMMPLNNKKSQFFRSFVPLFASVILLLLVGITTANLLISLTVFLILYFVPSYE